jgi:hypothetical protein
MPLVVAGKLSPKHLRTIHWNDDIPMRVDARLEVVKKRALELRGFLDLIQEGGE